MSEAAVLGESSHVALLAGFQRAGAVSHARARRLPERSIGLAPEFAALLRSEDERPDAGGVED